MEHSIAFEAATPGRRLSSVPFLSDCDESSLDALEAELEWLSVPGGATLFCEDQLPDALYVVIAGCLGVTVRGSDGGEVRVARCQVGETVGEMGLLGGGRRSATVTALRDTVLLRLGKSSFERLVERHPLLMLSIVSQLVHRLRTTARRGRDETASRTVALVPVVLRGSRIPPIIDLLVRAATVNSDTLARTVGAQASILFQPPLATVNLLDWQACDRAIDIGYRFATEKLAQLDQSIFHGPR